jgi:hypothetical protein
MNVREQHVVVTEQSASMHTMHESSFWLLSKSSTRGEVKIGDGASGDCM